MKDSESAGLRLRGYYPGVVGKITEVHAIYYSENWGFDVSFETQVGQELSDFIKNFEKDRDGFWVATVDGEFAGSIAIDGSNPEREGARLRWFIVPPKFQTLGIGTTLIREAIDFCKRMGFEKVYLWTFEGLDDARSLYEKEGFRLSEEHRVFQWGQNINEQMFQLDLQGFRS